MMWIFSACSSVILAAAFGENIDSKTSSLSQLSEPVHEVELSALCSCRDICVVVFHILYHGVVAQRGKILCIFCLEAIRASYSLP